MPKSSCISWISHGHVMLGALVLSLLHCPACKGDLDPDGDGYGYPEDCDQSNPDVNPDATEIPDDGVDNDCDTATPDDDLDGDGFAGAQDCDDDDASISPDATEIPYDGVNNDCDSATPDDDLDGDGYVSAQDCDDLDALRSPGLPEVCDDESVDEDCDGLINDEDPSVDSSTLSTWYFDSDRDGFGGAYSVRSCAQPERYFNDSTDCDDSDNSVYPGANEVCGDGVVNDCDASVSEARDTCSLAGGYSLGTIGIRYDGDSGNGRLGGRVVGVGDMNMDGFDDLMIGDTHYLDQGDGSSPPGAAYLIEGTLVMPGGSVGNYLQYTGRQDGNGSGDLLGAAIVGVGDFDGDGYPDAAIGAPNFDANYPDSDSSGVVYLLRGGVTMPESQQLSESESLAVVEIVGSYFEGGLGSSLGACGDVDADGYDDLLVGVIEAEEYPGDSHEGGFFVVFGGETASASLSATCANNRCARFVSGISDNQLGRGLFRVGDVTGDGAADFAVSGDGREIQGADNGDFGAIYLIYGSEVRRGMDEDITTSFHPRFLGRSGENIGSVGGGGVHVEGADINHDGYIDFLIGVPNSQTAIGGEVHLILGQAEEFLADLSMDVATTFTGEYAGDRAGISVATVGDVDVDGNDDILIGTEQTDVSSTSSAAAYLILGVADPETEYGTTLSLTDAQARFTSENLGDLAGGSVAAAGDVNADGFDDMLIGARQAVIDGSVLGAAYLILGGGY